MIVLDDDLINSCYQFAIKVTETTFDVYKSRNKNLSKEKAINDAFKGKLAEWYSYFWLVSHGRVTSYPCMKILPKQKKSHDADLVILSRGIHIHVKACKPNLHSVLFEKIDLEYMLKKNNQFVMIIEYTSPKEMKMISLRAARDYKYSAPIKKSLKSKLAIYL